MLEVLYIKGPDTTGIFRKVANARSVKDCIDKIERNIPLQDDDLHPILAAGVLKVSYFHLNKVLLLSNITSTSNRKIEGKRRSFHP